MISDLVPGVYSIGAHRGGASRGGPADGAIGVTQVEIAEADIDGVVVSLAIPSNYGARFASGRCPRLDWRDRRVTARTSDRFVARDGA